MAEPRELVERLEASPLLPKGDGERFSGYGVMACPFSSGDILCQRRFPASSIGPAYTSVWHRAPEGHWTIYQDVAPQQACTRFFGSAVASTINSRILTEWTGPRSLRIVVEDALEWDLDLASTVATRSMSGVGALMPEALWRSGSVLAAMSAVAGVALGAGKLALAGRSPNGQRFVANPLLIWAIPRSRAVLRGRDLGEVQPMREQTHLGDFWIPRTGLLAIGRAFFEPFDAERHLATTQAGQR